MTEPEKKRIQYDPTPGLSYDPSEPVYWDPKAVEGEVLRAFDICNGCRMCFKYCDSFPKLFALLDERDHDVHRLSPGEIQGVIDDCFQCKLCEVQCPYTPRDKHPYQLDFPKLVHRHGALRARRRGRLSLAGRARSLQSAFGSPMRFRKSPTSNERQLFSRSLKG